MSEFLTLSEYHGYLLKILHPEADRWMIYISDFICVLFATVILSYLVRLILFKFGMEDKYHA